MKKMQMPNLAGHLNLPFPKNGTDRNKFNIQPVSYTHLDVYKRQGKERKALTEQIQRTEKEIAEKLDKPVSYTHLDVYKRQFIRILI